MIGTQAQVPIFPGRAGSYTSVGAAGGQLNPATGQPTNQALYTMPYSWFQIELETSALVQTGTNAQSIIAAKDLEVQGAVENTRHQIARQIVTNGDGIVAACDTTASATTIKLVAAAAEGAAYGYSALARGWLPSGATTGQYIDIGTTADTDALATGVQVTGVVTSLTAPTITITGSAIATTLGTHFVYIANPNSTTTANPEVNGLRQIIGTGSFGGINPATSGNEFWQAASRDTATTTFALNLALGLQRGILQNGAEMGGGMEVWTSFKQQTNFYALLQNKVQFVGEQNMQAGDITKPTWNGMTVRAYPDVLDTDWFLVNVPDLVKVVGNVDKPTWASDMAGHSDGRSGMPWRQGFTSFVDAVVYPINIGARRRNTMAAATALQ
jgi:hypothetical protein